MFDISMYEEVRSRYPKKGWTTVYYVDRDGVCRGKTCSSCKKTLPADHFYRHVSNKYELGGNCRECTKDYRAHQDPATKRAHSKSTTDKYKNRTKQEVLIARDRLHPDGLKSCHKCKVERPFDHFTKGSYNPDGLTTLCRGCRAQKAKMLTEEDRIRLRGHYRTTYVNATSRAVDLIVSIQEELYPDSNKSCSSCGGVKPLTDFYPSKKYKDGLLYDCISCIRSSTSPYGENHRRYWLDSNIPVECYVCGSTDDIHSDHVIPKSLKGTHDKSNRLPLCEFHNTSKNDTPLSAWLYDRHPDIMDEVLFRVIVLYGVDPYVPQLRGAGQ